MLNVSSSIFSLHTAFQPQNQMQSRLPFDVVIRQRPSIFKLLSSEDDSLLVERDALFLLYLILETANTVIDGYVV